MSIFVQGAKILTAAAVLSVILMGCVQSSSPRQSVKNFIKAVKNSNAKELEGLMAFEGLIVDMQGEKYLAMPPQEKEKALADFKAKMIESLINGKSKQFGTIEMKFVSEKIEGDKAHVEITDAAHDNIGFVFQLAREGGVWKIYAIATK